jgi:hypothetical protein
MLTNHLASPSKCGSFAVAPTRLPWHTTRRQGRCRCGSTALFEQCFNQRNWCETASKKVLRRRN